MAGEYRPEIGTWCDRCKCGSNECRRDGEPAILSLVACNRSSSLRTIRGRTRYDLSFSPAFVDFSTVENLSRHFIFCVSLLSGNLAATFTPGQCFRDRFSNETPTNPARSGITFFYCGRSRFVKGNLHAGALANIVQFV